MTTAVNLLLLTRICSRDLVNVATALHESQSRRFYPYDFCIKGDILTAAHSVTGRDIGSIHLGKKSFMPMTDKDTSALSAILAGLCKEQQIASDQTYLNNHTFTMGEVGEVEARMANIEAMRAQPDAEWSRK